MHKYNTQFVRAQDGTKIAYEFLPADEPNRPTFLFCNGYATDHFYWRHVWDHYQGKANLITWDYRGHGCSGKSQTLAALTMKDVANDIALVLDATKTSSVILFGFSFGCQVVFEAWRQFPDRIAGILAFFGTFEHPFDHVFHPKVGPKLFKVFERSASFLAEKPMRLMGRLAHRRIGYRMGQLTGMIERSIPQEEMQPFFEHYGHLDIPSWVAMGRAAQAHSAGDVLETITVPALIVSGGLDSWTPSHMSDKMRRAIPNSDFAYFPKATHTALLGHAPQVLSEVDSFLDMRQILVI